MYQVPLRFIKISHTCAICATRITSMISMTTRQGRAIYRKEKQTGTLVNATGQGKARTLLFLDNGTVVASPCDIDKLVRALRMLEFRDELQSALKKNGNVQIYDIKDNEYEIDKLMRKFEEDQYLIPDEEYDISDDTDLRKFSKSDEDFDEDFDEEDDEDEDDEAGMSAAQESVKNAAIKRKEGKADEDR